MGKFLGIHKAVPYHGPVVTKSTLISDDFERLIFAPDPASGNPCSSLAFYAKGDDEVSKFVRDHYLKDVGTGTNGFVQGVDEDSALALAPNFGETREVYLERVVNMIKEYYEDESNN